MNSRARVLTSFQHKPPDRVPLDYSAVPEVDEMLMKHLDVPNRDALLEKLHVDFRHLDKWGAMIPQYVGPELPEHENDVFEDYWGLRLKRVEYRPGYFYTEWVDPPLADAETVQDVEKHRWPDSSWFDFSGVKGFCNEHREFCIVGGRGATFDSVGFFRGSEQAMTDIYDNPKMLEAILEKIFEFQYGYNVRLLEAAEGQLDILFFSEDMGGQNGLLVSRETLGRYVFPKLGKYAELAHEHGAMAMLHSDGDIHEIIPDLIDIGVEIINPVQPNCPGMDLARLKKDFGDKLSFHGLIDSQHVLPKAGRDEVLSEIKRLVALMGSDGGLALAPNCGFQIDVPVENILTIYQVQGI